MGRRLQIPEENLLKRTIMKMMMKNEMKPEFLSNLEDLWRKRRCIRLISTILISSIFYLCCSQVHDLVVYYYDEPTRTIVDPQEIADAKFPAIYVSSDFTPASEQFKMQLIRNSSFEHRMNYLPCNFLYQVTFEMLGLEAYKIWDLYKPRQIVDKIIVDAKLRKNVTIKLEDLHLLYKHSFKIVPDISLMEMGRRTRVTIHLIHPNSECLTSYVLFISPLNEVYVEEKEFSGFDFKSGYLLRFNIEKYIFLKKSKKPCVDDEIYNTCLKNNILNNFSNNITCRIPFCYGLYNKLDPCTNDSKIEIQFRNFMSVQAKNMQILSNNCPLPCNNENINIIIDELPFHIYTISMEVNDVMVYKEEPIYDTISLLCDIGGNVGMFLGLCVIHVVVMIMYSFSHPHTDVNRYKKIEKIYVLEMMKAKRKMLRRHSGEQEKKMKKLSQLVFIILCFCFMAIIFYRLEYYFSYPIFVTIEITSDMTIPIPSFIVCLNEVKIISDYIKKQRIDCNNPHNDILNLLTPPSKYQHNPIKLWNDAHLMDRYICLIDIFPYKHCHHSYFATEFGICSKFFNDPHRVGKNLFVRILYMLNTVICDFRAKVFLMNIDGIIDPHTILLFDGRTSNLAVTTKTVIHQNLPNRPCISEEYSAKCHKNCFEKKQKETKYLCRLPFMSFSNLSLCNTTKAARLTQQMYSKTHFNTNPVKDCSCLRKCKETIFKFLDTVYEKNERNLAISIDINSKVHGVIREERSFTFIKFLCDIGSNLGIFLGGSCFSLTYFAFNKIKSK